MRNIDKRRFKRLRDTSAYISRALRMIDVTDYDYEIPTHITGFNNAEYTKLIEDASTETDAQKRSELLHQAEKLLLDNMPVIPIIFNQNAYLQNADLSKVKANFYTPFEISLELDAVSEPSLTKTSA